MMTPLAANTIDLLQHREADEELLPIIFQQDSSLLF
jgi:hypothetical protein